jgi:hypothetical protein
MRPVKPSWPTGGYARLHTSRRPPGPQLLKRGLEAGARGSVVAELGQDPVGKPDLGSATLSGRPVRSEASNLG